MKQSWFVIVFAVLMLSACGKKSEESAAANVPPPLESNPIAVQPAMQPPAEQKTPEKMSEKTASTSAADTPATSPAAETKKPMKASGGMQPLSREEGRACRVEPPHGRFMLMIHRAQHGEQRERVYEDRRRHDSTAFLGLQWM